MNCMLAGAGAAQIFDGEYDYVKKGGQYIFQRMQDIFREK